MRERIAYVIAAYVNADGKVDLYKIRIDLWRKHSRPGASGTPGNLTLTQMTLRDLERFGRRMAQNIYI